MIDADELISEFVRVAELAGLKINKGTLKIENLPAPHIPPSTLPAGKTGTYLSRKISIPSEGDSTLGRFPLLRVSTSTE